VALAAPLAATPLGEALRRELEAAGVAEVESLEPPADQTPDRHRLRGLDILVVGADRAGVTWIERFAAAAAGRKLPPEVWALAASSGRASEGARETFRFWKDPRVIYRHIAVSDRALWDEGAARAASRRTLRGVRRGFNLVPAGGLARGFAAYRSLCAQTLAGARS
jgi:hypothetical protein